MKIVIRSDAVACDDYVLDGEKLAGFFNHEADDFVAFSRAMLKGRRLDANFPLGEAFNIRLLRYGDPVRSLIHFFTHDRMEIAEGFNDLKEFYFGYGLYWGISATEMVEKRFQDDINDGILGYFSFLRRISTGLDGLVLKEKGSYVSAHMRLNDKSTRDGIIRSAMGDTKNSGLLAWDIGLKQRNLKYIFDAFASIGGREGVSMRNSEGSVGYSDFLVLDGIVNGFLNARVEEAFS